MFSPQYDIKDKLNALNEIKFVILNFIQFAKAKILLTGKGLKHKTNNTFLEKHPFT